MTLLAQIPLPAGSAASAASSTPASPVTSSPATSSPVTSSPATYFAPPDVNRASRGRRALAIAAVVAVHLLALIAIVHAALRPEPAPPVQALTVRMVELLPPAPPRVEAPKPVPPKAPPKRVQTPPPVLAAAPVAPVSPAVFAVPPQPQPEPVVAAPAPAPTPAPVAAAAPIVDARFDADYLQNPPPVYPATSRRQHEEGRVVLRVRVSRDGRPLSVEVRQSSGFSRLDEAAKSAVERWRFVPASQGGEPIESSVLVPLNFTLSN